MVKPTMAILLTGTRVCSLISTTKIVVSNGATDPSPIRLINDISPVKGAFNPAMNCGPNARKAQVVAPAKPGSKMSFFWASGQPSEPWPHNIGPMITYMAECTGTTCDKFDAAQAKWFKIDEVGRKPDNKNEWVQKDLQRELNREPPLCLARWLTFHC